MIPDLSILKSMNIYMFKVTEAYYNIYYYHLLLGNLF